MNNKKINEKETVDKTTIEQETVELSVDQENQDESSIETVVELTPEMLTEPESSDDLDNEESVVEEDLAGRIVALEAQVAELNDKSLRALAEAENVRRRAQRDKEDAVRFGIKNFAAGMLGIADNLGRALASIDSETRAKDQNLENILIGVEMVQKELMNTFERNGVIPIKALGEKFDPMKHEAMFEVEDEDTPSGTIAQVLELGYMLNGRTLRAAKVGITKGGPKDPDVVSKSSQKTLDTTESRTRDGQAAYETQADQQTTSGGTFDEEL